MVEPVGQTTFAEGFDETSFLLAGVALLLVLLAAQILWAQYNRKRGARSRDSGPVHRGEETEGGPEMGEGMEAKRVPAGDGEEGRGFGDVDSEEYEFEGEAVRCPECARPTEAEYRFCRHCASDTGKSYVGGGNDDGSSRSGMF